MKREGPDTQVVLVTGASRGIGRGIAFELARAGIVPAIHYNGNRDAALESAARCASILGGAEDTTRAGGAGGREASIALPVFQADLADPDSRARLVAGVLEAFGRLDGLVNNAGIAPRRRDDILEADETIFDEVLGVNLKGPYFLTQRVARHWVENPSDALRHIVFVTSVSATMASVKRGEYCVSKAGLAMTAQLFAARLAADGVVVVEVRPGIIDTDMTSGVKSHYDERIAGGLVPQGRWGMPEDVGRTVRAIMCGDLGFATGSVIYVDGGLHLQQL